MDSNHQPNVSSSPHLPRVTASIVSIMSTQQTETALTSDCAHTLRWCCASNNIDLASHERQELFGLNCRAWLARLEVEQGNLEAALEWSQ